MGTSENQALELAGAQNSVEPTLVAPEEVKEAKWELLEKEERGPELGTQAEQLGVLIKVRENNALAIGRTETLVLHEQSELARVRESLGMPALQDGTELSSEVTLENLKREREQLEQKRLELVKEEMGRVWHEKITATFEVFRQIPREQFEIVLQTGKIPSGYEMFLKLLSSLFGNAEESAKKETEYIIILAQAFDRGFTNEADIVRELPKFAELEKELQTTVADIATERLLKEPEQKLIEDAEKAPELEYTEPNQIPEVSGAEGSPASVEGAVAQGK